MQKVQHAPVPWPGLDFWYEIRVQRGLYEPHNNSITCKLAPKSHSANSAEELRTGSRAGYIFEDEMQLKLSHLRTRDHPDKRHTASSEQPPSENV